MIPGKVRGNTVRTGGILLPFGQNCSPSCNVNTEIPIQYLRMPKGFPVIKLQSKMSQRQGLHCVFGKFLTRKLVGTPTRPIVRFFVVFLTLSSTSIQAQCISSTSLTIQHSLTTLPLTVTVQGCTNAGREIFQPTKFCRMAPNIRELLLWNLLHIHPIWRQKF